MLNVTDTKIIKLYIDMDPFDLCTGTLISFHRILDLKSATVKRDIIWQSPSGKGIAFKSQRLVSFTEPHLAAISYEVTVLDEPATVEISSEMIANESNQVSEGDPREAAPLYGQVLLPRSAHADKTRVFLCHTTRHSQLTLACGMEHQIDTAGQYTTDAHCSKSSAKVVFSVDAQPGQPVRLTKYMTYHSSPTRAPKELCADGTETLDRALAGGFDKLLTAQKEYMAAFWSNSDMIIDGDPALQQSVRFSLFQVLQAAGRDGRRGIAAKGLTGQGYEGHYFWDTEIYVLPFLIYTVPDIARKLLEFRYSILDSARKRARDVSQKGELLPWRTIDGEEASAYYPAGTAQYHINADIMFALKKYVDATGDESFLHACGAEMLIETARFWNDLGAYVPHKGGRFCINGVTGPDEYTALVNNNVYTNMMARFNLEYAAATVVSLRKEQPTVLKAIADRTGLEASEVEEWKQAAASMYIPYDEERGIHPQEDTFLDKAVWDFANVPAENYPLLLHYHPLVIYRYQVIKQPDLVLAMFLQGRHFSAAQKKRNFEYYDPLTTGDSSLSPCVQGVMAAEVGDIEKAYDYFMQSAEMDLDDVDHNVKDGVHIASIGGTWISLVYGFAGMRDEEGRLSFRPRLPRKWGG